MRRRTRLLLVSLVIVGSLLLAGVSYFTWTAGEILAGFFAKTLCSCVFVSKRTPAACLTEDLDGYAYVSATVDSEGRRVRARALLIGTADAEYEEGYGCTLR